MKKGQSKVIVNVTGGKATPTVKAIDALLTSYVIEALGRLRNTKKDLKGVTEYIFDTAIIHGYRAGVRLYKGGKPVDNFGDWTAEGRKHVLQLRDFLNQAFIGAANLKAGKKEAIVMTEDLQYFCEYYGELLENRDNAINLLREVFEVTMFYLPAAESEPLNGAGLADYALLLADLSNLLRSCREAQHAKDIDYCMPVYRAIRSKFPADITPAARLKGDYLISINNNAPVKFHVDFLESTGKYLLIMKDSGGVDTVQIADITSISEI